MKPHKSPCSISKVVRISKTSNFQREEGEDKNYEFKGGICKDSRYAWITWGPFFKVVDVATGEKIAGWRFGASHLEFYTKVLCVTELPSCENLPTVNQFVVGLDCEVSEGMICILNVQGSRLLRAIRVPGKVVSLSVVDGGTEGRYPLPGLLSSMSGIIAAGLQGGEVLLLDLCRITCDELLNTWFSDDRENVKDEVCPCQLVPISRRDNESEKLEDLRTEAARTGNHLSLLLNETSFILENFVLLGPDGEIRAHFQRPHVTVTSLLYIPRIASIVVGFNFGCFQIWNLMHLNLNFTSVIMDDPIPIVHLGFQEPSDDPRNFCYVWAIHSSSDLHISSSTPLGVMYALCYESKEWVDGYGCLYQDFQSCNLRFEYDLRADCNDPQANTCISFYTLSNATPAHRNLLEGDYDEADLENNLSLGVFVWESYGSLGKPNAAYLSLFDLDQWYKDQMPSAVLDADNSPEPSYLAMFSLGDLGENYPGPNPLLDVRIDSKTLSQFKSFRSLEEHFHPTALSFVSCCLLSWEIVFMDHPGLQKNVLLHMEKEGPLSILHPTRIFKHCLNIGLKPILCEVTSAVDFSVGEQREFLLSLALENQMLGFLYRCGSEWGSGAQSIAGCTLQVLLDWAWMRATIMKEQADTICIPLFNHSGERLDKNECSDLDKCTNQLHHLALLFKSITNDYRIPKMQIHLELNQKVNALQLAALYFEVVQWFLNVGLLPECPEDESKQDEVRLQKIPYSATKLSKIYHKRRKELEHINMKSNSRINLFIDEMIDHESGADQLSLLWKRDGGSGNFPPLSLQSLLGTYLVDGIETCIKHSIVIYVFLDLAALLDTNSYGKAIDYLIKFPSAFRMSPSIIKLTQAFWLLDHQNFEEAFDMLLDPLVTPSDLQPWQHRYIVQTFLVQGHESKALDYFSVRKLPVSNLEDIRLKITLLVVNGQITQAYHFLQQHRNENNSIALLEHFLKDCKEMNQLGMIMKLFLTPLEEEAFMNFLETCKDPRAKDMRVLYYLMRSRIVEAIDTKEKNHCNTIKRSHEEQSVCDILVDGYAKTLPNVTRHLARYCAQEKKAFVNWRQVERPTPLSVDIHHGVSKPVHYKSSLIHTTLAKARETWLGDSTPKEKDISDVTGMQNMPFLCIPLDGLRNEREMTPVVFPTLTCQSIKRFFNEPGDTPSKRSRYEKDSLSNTDQKKKEYSSRDDASSLLQSPHVIRIPLRKSLVGENNTTTGPLGEDFAPHSILKVRNVVHRSPTPDGVSQSATTSGNTTTPEILQEKEEEKTVPTARQIRFSLPRMRELEDDNLHAHVGISTIERISRRTGIIGGTPRQALHLASSRSVFQKNLSRTEFKDSQSPMKLEEVDIASSLKRKAIRSSVDDTSMQFSSCNESSKLSLAYAKELSLTTLAIPLDNSCKSVEDNVNNSVEDDSFHSFNNSESSLNSETSKGKDAGMFDENVLLMQSPYKKPRVRSPIHEMKDKNIMRHSGTEIENESSNILRDLHHIGNSKCQADFSALLKEEFVKTEKVHILESREYIQFAKDCNNLVKSNACYDVLMDNTNVELSEGEETHIVEEFPQIEYVNDIEGEKRMKSQDNHPEIVFLNKVTLQESEETILGEYLHTVKHVAEECTLKKQENIKYVENGVDVVLQINETAKGDADNTDINIAEFGASVKVHAGAETIDCRTENSNAHLTESANNVQVQSSTHRERKIYDIVAPVQVEEFSEDIGDIHEGADQNIVLVVSQQLPDLLSKMEDQTRLENVVQKSTRDEVKCLAPAVLGASELSNVLFGTVEVGSDPSFINSCHSIEAKANANELKDELELVVRHEKFEEEAIDKIKSDIELEVGSRVMECEYEMNNANDPLLSGVNTKISYDECNKLVSNDDIIGLHSYSDLECEVQDENDKCVDRSLIIRKRTFCEASKDGDDNKDSISNEPLIVHGLKNESISISSDSVGFQDFISGQKYEACQFINKNKTVIMKDRRNKEVLQLRDHFEITKNASITEVKEKSLGKTDFQMLESGIRNFGPDYDVNEKFKVVVVMDNVITGNVEVNIKDKIGDEHSVKSERTIASMDLNTPFKIDETCDSLKHRTISNRSKPLVSDVVEKCMHTLQEEGFRTSSVQNKSLEHSDAGDPGQKTSICKKTECNLCSVQSESSKCVEIDRIVKSDIKKTDYAHSFISSESFSDSDLGENVHRQFEKKQAVSIISSVQSETPKISDEVTKETQNKRKRNRKAKNNTVSVQSEPLTLSDLEVTNEVFRDNNTNSNSHCLVSGISKSLPPSNQHGRRSKGNSFQSKGPELSKTMEVLDIKELISEMIERACSRDSSVERNIAVSDDSESRHLVRGQCNIYPNNEFNFKDDKLVHKIESVQRTSPDLSKGVKEISKITGNVKVNIGTMKSSLTTNHLQSVENSIIEGTSNDAVIPFIPSDATGLQVIVSEEPKGNELCVNRKVSTRRCTRKNSVSSNSLVGDSREWPVVNSECESTCKSSISDSSKSTLIFARNVNSDNAGQLSVNISSTKRRKSPSSMSSHINSDLSYTTNNSSSKSERRRRKKITRPCKLSSKLEKDEESLKESKEQSCHEVMEQYVIARRLTRHQHSLLKKSLEVSKTKTEQNRYHRRVSTRANRESDNESSESSVCLQEPSKEKSLSTRNLEPAPSKKAVPLRPTRRSLGKSMRSEVDRKSSSPTSGKSKDSSELDSLALHSVDEEFSHSSRPARRRSARLSLSRDTHDPVLTSITKLKAQSQDGDTDSEVGSIVSQSSVLSTGGERITRFSSRNRKVDLEEVKTSSELTQIKINEENQNPFIFSPPTVVHQSFENEVGTRSNPAPTLISSLPQTLQNQYGSNDVTPHLIIPALQTIEEEPCSGSSIPSVVEKKFRRKKSQDSSTGTSHKRRSRALGFFSPKSGNETAAASSHTSREIEDITEQHNLNTSQSKPIVYTSLKIRKSFKLRRKSDK